MINRSFQAKLIFVMLLLTILPMIVVMVFLVRGVQSFYTTQFSSQMEDAFTQGELLRELRAAAEMEEPASHMKDILRVYGGQLGIDISTRNYYILDAQTAEVLETSNPDGDIQINITPNILSAMQGGNAYDRTIKSNYMDIAVPISGGDGSFVVYIIDNKQIVQGLNAEIFELILETVLIGVAISIAISLFISRALLSPIRGMTRAAEAMADGDFSSKISVESDDEIGVLSRTFNDMAAQIESMLEELKNSEKLRREFVANVSHELRTPLTSIRTYAETLYDSPELSEETESDFLHVIVNESDRMTKIVRDLLELSRFDAGNTELVIEEFSIEQALRNVCVAVALEASRRGQDFKLEIEEKLPVIFGDKARIEQVLMNIVINALNYTPDEGKVNVFANSTGEGISITISDTGIGIPKEDLPRVFDRFYRVDKARSRESGGTGLGLPIAKEIVTMHGGDIQISSTPGEGTTVTITLPLGGTGET